MRGASRSTRSRQAITIDLRNPHDPDELPGDVHDILREHEELLTQVAVTRSVLKAGLTTSLVTDGIEAAKLQRFLENFDLVADLPLAHLRHTVIRLAAQGRLVSPDPSDASPQASLPLFAAVAVERDDNTYPAHWLRVPLGSAGEWRGGGTPSKLQSEYWDGTIPWVSPKDMKVLRISDAQDHISESAVDASSVRIIPANSLLMVVRGMILARAFPVALTTRAVTINQDMKALLPLEAEAAEFLLLALRALEPDVLALIERSTHGTCKLQTDALEALLIPIPPLGEQRRIVAKVEELMRDVDALEAQLTRLQQVGVAVVSAIVADVTLEDYV